MESMSRSHPVRAAPYPDVMLILIARRIRVSRRPIKQAWRSISVHLPPRNFITLHYLYFIATCLLTSVIFWGSSTSSKPVSYTDSLFLTVSAMTLAGLNTVNLSELNSFQQSILFVLIMLGSAIFVSVMVVHVRRKAFERRFQTILDDRRRQRKGLSGSKQCSSPSESGLRTQTGREFDSAVIRGKAIQPTDQPNNAAADQRPCVEENDQEHDLVRDLGEQGRSASVPGNDDNSTAVGDSAPRRITFSPPTSPTRVRQHTRVFSMQGVGARQNILNHPSQSSFQIYPIVSAAETEIKLEPPQDPLDLPLATGFIGRNSQFSHLTLAEREQLGGVEYRAVTFLAVIVPMYFGLWQLLGSLGLGAYIARNRPNVTRENGLNPWYFT